MATLLSDGTGPVLHEMTARRYSEVVATIRNVCEKHGLSYTAEIAKRAAGREVKSYVDVRHELTQLNDSLTIELEREAIFRISPERTGYYERDDLFGTEVAAAFPSCERDIKKAGSCYALEQEDGCVHHLMLVLERGLRALAVKLGVTDVQANWQRMIDKIGSELKTVPSGSQKDFYRDVNAQFGFLKDAYRNHSQHVHDDPYDMAKASSIFNHVRAFMLALVKGGLTE